MKRRNFIYLIPTVLLLLILIMGLRSHDDSHEVFASGKVYKLSDKMSSPITVKVLEIKGEWILIDPAYTKTLEDDSVKMWINTSRFSIAQPIDF